MRTAVIPVIALELLLGFGEASAPADDGGLRGLILAHSERARLSPRFLRAVISVESQFSPRAVSRRGARGLMQVMPATAEEFGVPAGELGRPGPNLRAGTAYLDFLYRTARGRYKLKAERLGDAPPWVQHRVLAAYNGGPRLLFHDRWPGQTRRYVARVTRLAGLRPPRPFVEPAAPPPAAAVPAPGPVPLAAAPERAWTLDL